VTCTALALLSSNHASLSIELCCCFFWNLIAAFQDIINFPVTGGPMPLPSLHGNCWRQGKQCNCWQCWINVLLLFAVANWHCCWQHCCCSLVFLLISPPPCCHLSPPQVDCPINILFHYCAAACCCSFCCWRHHFQKHCHLLLLLLHFDAAW